MEGFKKRATEHLQKYVASRGVSFHSYCILQDDDALLHQFFPWKNMHSEIGSKYKSIKGKSGVLKSPLKNMLRSEHIAFNLFVPLKFNQDKAAVITFFKKLLNRNDLKLVRKITIEWAPNDVLTTLNDKTSFDAYAEFGLENHNFLAVGIEVKYTEQSYPYGDKEREYLQTQDERSPYYRVWNSAVSEYKPDTYETLGYKSYKQYFRNHLLGLSMIKNGLVDEFISMHLYPSGNTYQEKTATEYKDTIKPEMQKTFMPITFEEFIDTGLSAFPIKKEREWLEYLQARYIV